MKEYFLIVVECDVSVCCECVKAMMDKLEEKRGLKVLNVERIKLEEVLHESD